MKFRKKPVTIEAIKWEGINRKEIVEFVGEASCRFEMGGLYILTLEGPHLARIGDWIIRGVKGEYYPCKPDIFEMTYEKVEDQ